MFVNGCLWLDGLNLTDWFDRTLEMERVTAGTWQYLLFMQQISELFFSMRLFTSEACLFIRDINRKGCVCPTAAALNAERGRGLSPTHYSSVIRSYLTFTASLSTISKLFSRFLEPQRTFSLRSCGNAVFQHFQRRYSMGPRKFFINILGIFFLVFVRRFLFCGWDIRFLFTGHLKWVFYEHIAILWNRIFEKYIIHTIWQKSAVL